MSKNGSQAEFIELIDRHRGILFKIAGAYCGSPAHREDLIAESIAALWRSWRRFDGRAAFSTWMYRVALNVAISYRRRESRRERHWMPAGQAVLEAVAAPSEPAADEALAYLHELIEELEPLDRGLMLLYLDEHSHAEIAATLGISTSNVASKICRIKERFRRKIAGQVR
jgi:RNA polymerase sigma-70 factor, ECF subfamily